MNGDPPALAAIWRSHSTPRSMTQPLSATMLVETVLAKPYFENAGLIVALQDNHPIGFVHAGFGPNADETSLDKSTGTVCALVLNPAGWHGEAPQGLLAAAEDYLRAAGAQAVWGGGAPCFSPFYMGLLGGSRQYGVPASDAAGQAAFAAAGYQQADCYSVRHRDLRSFRPPMNRKLMQLRRQLIVERLNDPATTTWWAACTVGACERTVFVARGKDGGPALASVSFWNMEPLAHRWGVRAAGMLRLTVEPDRRRQGLATYLLCEAFRQLAEEGISLIEAQAPCGDAAARGLFDSFGLTEIEQGIMFRK